MSGLDIYVASHIPQNQSRLKHLVLSWGANPISINSAGEGLDALEHAVSSAITDAQVAFLRNS